MPDNKPKKRNVHEIAWVQSLAAVVVIFGALAGLIYLQSTSGVVEIENSMLDAPIETVAPSTPGMLNALYVKEGDHITANAPVALVGTETLYAKESGIVLGAPRALGSYYGPGQKVLSIIADQKMRVVATIDETKGLEEINPGEPVIFTVDAYPGKITTASWIPSAPPRTRPAYFSPSPTRGRSRNSTCTSASTHPNIRS